ncbi:hypothetical protein BJ165DRAFT_1397835 [Panaeolus papilionaceus]|nr:hypothetical protein BJ165DRAFT_1397835 [Panaeolus papilionaceus]
MTESKRVETDELRRELDSSDRFSLSTGIDDDLTQRLRSVGARVRKNVTEGYRTTPSSFSRAQTTGAIFTSMRDAMIDAYGNTSTTRDDQNTDPRVLKRSRSFEASNEAQSNDSESTTTQLNEARVPRPIRPLRTPSRPFLSTQSMPVGAFSMGIRREQDGPSANKRETTTIEEDDWSGESLSQPFQPMVLE